MYPYIRKTLTIPPRRPLPFSRSISHTAINENNRSESIDMPNCVSNRYTIHISKYTVHQQYQSNIKI